MISSTYTQELYKELERLNASIDKKILKGQSFSKEARRHKELLLSLRKLQKHSVESVTPRRRVWRRVKSPVRKSLDRGVVARLFIPTVSY